MSYLREQAVEVINRLYQKNRITTSEYETIFEALDEFETLRDRDTELEELWERFGDIPMNPETECIEEPFLGWGEGIHREEIWHWFDERHSKGVYYLLYGEDGTGKLGELLRLMKSNPKIPVVAMVDPEIVAEEGYGRWLASFGYASVGEYTLYDDRYFDDKDDFIECYYDNNDELLCEKYNYNPRICEETVKRGEFTAEQLERNEKAETEMDKYLRHIAEKWFRKAIIVNIDLPE